MKKNKYEILRLTLSALLLLLPISSKGCRGSLPEKPEKAPAPTYPSLRESFDQDFHQALATALEKEFRGEYKRTFENKKAGFVVVDIIE